MKIIQWEKLSQAEKINCLMRPDSGAQQDRIGCDVQAIIDTVKAQGDKALLDYTAQFDKVDLTSLEVTQQEIEEGCAKVDSNAKQAIEYAIARIKRYQQATKPAAVSLDTNDGVICERVPQPIRRVGLYVPGGSAPLVSTLMMLAIPAEIAGCRLKVMVTPPERDGSINPLLLLTANLCGIDKIYKVGGAQAIAALAYGTQTIPRVDKIFGPGNSYVTTAKQQVAMSSSGVTIDMPAGPSEVLVIADRGANPSYIAADMLAQLEHGPDSQALLVTDSETLANAVNNTIDAQRKTLSRQAILDVSLKSARIIVANNMQAVCEIANQYAAEHVIIHSDSLDPKTIDAAGSVFVGAYAPETLGDYVTGANHVLPTAGYARSVGGLSVSDFMHTVSIQTISRAGLAQLAESAITLAKLEGLDAHANAVEIRLRG